MNNHTNILKRSLLVTAIATALSSTAVQAQQETETENEEAGYERILVTASKRPMTLQDTPIAVTVTSKLDIEQAKIQDITDLSILVPTLRSRPSSRISGTTFSIRGFGSSASLGTEPSVGVFVDGVFRSRASGALGDLPRVERVEVLSGPQSTLFGKNASAGVISIVTAEPSYASEGRVELTYGNYNQRIVKGHYTNGLSDEVAFSISGGINKRDGYTESLDGKVETSRPIDPRSTDNKNRWNARAQLLWEPTTETKVRFIADHSSIDESCCFAPNYINGNTQFVIKALGAHVIEGGDVFHRTHNLMEIPGTEIKDSGISMHIESEFEDFSVTSISAYRKNTSNGVSGVTGSANIDIARGAGTAGAEIKAFSQEIRLTSTTDSDFSWMAGAFFYDEEGIADGGIKYGADLRPYGNGLVGGALAGVEAALGSFGYDIAVGDAFKEGSVEKTLQGQDNTDYSFFATTDYKFTDSLTGTFGLNYTRDKKTAFVDQYENTDKFARINLTGTPFAGFAAFQFRPPIVNLPNSVENNKSDDSDTTYQIRLAYKHNENMNFYASRATGFKSTAWDLSNFAKPTRADEAALIASGEVSSNPKYGSRLSTPEYSTVHELGMKLWYKEFALNVAVFDQSLEDFQVRSFDGVDFFQANAGETSVNGMEFDARYSVSKNLTFTFAGTLLDPKYVDFSNAPPGPNSPRDADGNRIPDDLSGTDVPGIHKTSLAAGVVYTQTLDNGMDLYFRADYQYESSTEVARKDSLLPRNADGTGGNEAVLRQVNNLGLSAGLNLNNGVNIQLWGRNMTNDENIYTLYGAAAQSGTVQSFVSSPRMYGVSVSYQF